MDDPAVEKGRAYRMDAVHSEAEAQAILESSAAKDPSLEQVREILFGAESRRVESARRALESQVAERFGRLEADYERRFEKLLQELHQRFEKACALLEAETAERRKALQSQHTELSTRLEQAAQALGAQKTSRDELANLLDEVANRLRAASGG
jgi:hypothetical protein